MSPSQQNTLNQIQRRILWLATLIVHHANHVRPNPDGTKIGGHQASSASTVSILTALYFHFLRAGDRVAIKPHASPVFHAIQYLLGQLPQQYLTTLREYKGLQAYPSRTKDPDPVDFSTGSVGLGAVAPAFAALTAHYAHLHFGGKEAGLGRYVALLGDAELDEGMVWEAILDESLEGVDNLLWIVDLNRQSLDRVVPGIRAARLKRLFADLGWRVLEAKYGRHLQALFARPSGEALRQRIDEMSNEEYQALIRLPGPELRGRLAQGEQAIADTLAEVGDDDLPGLLANLGGHDLDELVAQLAQVDSGTPRPTILFAYTIKGWGLPFAGHPLNHSMLLSSEQMETLRHSLGIAAGAEWDRFAPDTPESQWCAEVAARLYRPTETLPVTGACEVPEQLNQSVFDQANTQEVFGRLLVRLAEVPGVRERLVTCSPDVAVSTNLAGWINKTGVYSPGEKQDYESEAQRLLRWKRGPTGQHIELGISEMNLFMLLGMLGLSAEMCGECLIPIGTVYDPFVIRGLDALIYSLYSGAKFIVVGTPSGISLSPEGGAHQSTITPSIGAELPDLMMYEPCYARELEWILLEAIRACFDREHGTSTYLRLSTMPIEQHPFGEAQQRLGEAALRTHVLAGGYRLAEAPARVVNLGFSTTVNLVATGVMVPEALKAAAYLWEEGVAANVLNLTSPRKLFAGWRATKQLPAWLIPSSERHAPIITVQDGAAHSLAWLGSVYGAPGTALGVEQFGQSGARAVLYQHYGIDAMSIAEAAFEMLER